MNLKEATAEEGKLKSQNVSELEPSEREGTSLLSHAAKKLNIGTQEKKSRK